MSISAEEKDRYLRETAIVLAREGFRTDRTDTGKLRVLLDGAPLCEVTENGGITYRNEDINEPERINAKDKVLAVRRYDSLQRWIQAIEAERHQPADFAALDAATSANKRDFGSRYARAQALLAQERFTEAMDELLEILMRDKTWDEDRARKTYIAILDIMEPPRVAVAEGQIPAEDATVASYRRRLSSVVLS